MQMLQRCSAADEQAPPPVSVMQVPGRQVSGISQHGARISSNLGESVFGLTLVSRLRSIS